MIDIFLYSILIIIGFIGLIIGKFSLEASKRKERTFKPPTYGQNIPSVLKEKIEKEKRERKRYIIYGD